MIDISGSNPPTPSAVPLDDFGALVSSLRSAEASLAQWREAVDELRRVLAERLGDAKVGTIDGQPVVKHTTYTDTRVSTKKLKELAAPELVEQCTTTSTRQRFTLVKLDSDTA